MASIERTAYPRFKRTPTPRELRDLYTPTPEEVAFVMRHARGEAQKFALLILLKVFQRLGYFPQPETIPGVIITHLRRALKLNEELVPDIGSSHTLYRYYAVIRAELEVQSQPMHIRRVASRAMASAASVMEDPADLISAAVEVLVKEHCELPAFSTLDRLAGRIRTLVHGRMYQTILARLAPDRQAQLERLLAREEPAHFTDFNRLKEAPKSATLTHLDDWLGRLTWLQSLGDMGPVVEGLRPAKIRHLAQEAHALHATHLSEMTPPKRLALLVCLLHQATVSTRDEIILMVLKRMSKLTDRAKQELERLRAEERTTSEQLIAVLSQVVQATTETEDPTETSTQVRAVLERAGGTARLLEQCEQVSAHHGDRYQPFVWRFYASHRQALFRVIKTLELGSTTQDRALLEALHFISALELTSKKYRQATLDLSFASEKWLQTVQVRRQGKSWVLRQHLETCVFTYLAKELKAGDLYVRGSEQFADYREQLLSWEDCAPKVAEYCQRVGFPATADGLVAHLREELTQVAAQVDRTRPQNHGLIITDKGEPALRKTPAKREPAGLALLEAALAAKLPERHLLDILSRVDHWTDFTRHFGPLSGNEPKTSDARARHLLTVFAYSTNLGPHQLARHLRGQYSAEQIAHTNRLHITSDKLDAALREVINRFHRFTLPRYWGDEKRVAADGTQYELAEENLLAEKHIRYGGYGGIAYYHVSDLYILLFGHFIACGVWEAVYLLDGLIRNRSAIRPDTVHADTQGQNLPVFALAYLLGIQLMPRIRNWKDLKFYRPSKDTVYEHLEALFQDNVVEWDLIHTHWQDLLRIVLSIQEGKVLPSMLLKRLTTYSRKNKLYQAFRALGTVIRTIFLLKLLSDVQLRAIIHRVTNKVEQYHAFSGWLSFGNGGTIYEQAFEDQEKRIKYISLLANCVILDNTVEISAALNALAAEGWSPTREQLEALSPYQTASIKRFGNYEVDLATLPPPITDDLTFALEPPAAPPIVEAEQGDER